MPDRMTRRLEHVNRIPRDLIRPTPMEVAMDELARERDFGEPLGMPEDLDGGVFVRKYARGGIVSCPPGMFALHGPLMPPWIEHRARLGFPTTHSERLPSAARLACELADLYANDTIGARTVADPFRQALHAAGGVSAWGLPASESYVPLTRDGIAQLFTRGAAVVRSDGSARLVPRYPLFVLAAGELFVPPEVTAGLRAAIGFPGVAASPQIHSVLVEGIRHLAVWLHPIDEDAGIELVRHHLRAQTTPWSMTAYGDGLADALAMYLDTMDYRLDSDGIDVEILNASVEFSPDDHPESGLLTLQARVRVDPRNVPAIVGDVTVRDRITKNEQTGGLSTHREVQAHTDEPWLHAVINAFAGIFGAPLFAGSAALDDIVDAVIPDLPVLRLTDLVPVPYEVLIPNEPKKVRLTAALVVGLPAEPDRLEVSGHIESLDRKPSVSLAHGPNTVSASTRDMRDPQFRWGFSWNDERPTGRIVPLNLPATAPAAPLRAFVHVTDADGGDVKASRVIPSAPPTIPRPGRGPVGGPRRREL